MARGLTLLIDAASLIFRALFSTPDSIKSPEGEPINAAYGFLGMLARLVADHDPDFICCAADLDWRPEWRVALIESYKAFRAAADSAQEQAEDVLAPQLPALFELVTACGIPIVGHAGYEAEDVIGTLARRAPARVGIVSGDRDLFQLVRDPDVYVLYPRRGVSEMDVVDESYIAEHYGIPGRAYLDFAVLRGDPSDGLPGVKGIGPKLASGLVSRYGSIDEIISAAEGSEGGVALAKVRKDLDYVRRALRVATIATELPIPDVDLSRPRREPPPTVYERAAAHGLAGPTRRLGAALASTGERA